MNGVRFSVTVTVVLIDDVDDDDDDSIDADDLHAVSECLMTLVTGRLHFEWMVVLLKYLKLIRQETFRENMLLKWPFMRAKKAI